jgi:hypothetical protein
MRLLMPPVLSLCHRSPKDNDTCPKQDRWSSCDQPHISFRMLAYLRKSVTWIITSVVGVGAVLLNKSALSNTMSHHHHDPLPAVPEVNTGLASDGWFRYSAVSMLASLAEPAWAGAAAVNLVSRIWG